MCVAHLGLKPCNVAVAAHHSLIFQASYYHIWLQYRWMIQTGVSGSWHTLLTQLLLTSLLPHSIIIRDNRLESVSVIRWLRWTLAGSEVDNQGMCHEADNQKMVDKCLPKSQRKGFCHSISPCVSADGKFDRFWQALALLHDLALCCLNLTGQSGKQRHLFRLNDNWRKQVQG